MELAAEVVVTFEVFSYSLLSLDGSCWDFTFLRLIDDLLVLRVLSEFQGAKVRSRIKKINSLLKTGN